MRRMHAPAAGDISMEARKLKADADAFQLSLRIRHPSMDPAEISRQLGIQSEHAFRAGDARPVRSAVTPAAVHTESYWLGVVPPQLLALELSFPGDARSQLAQKGLQSSLKGLTWGLSLSAVRFLRSHAEFLKRIRSGGGEISLLVALSGAGEMSFSLPPGTGRFFADLGVTLEFEISGE
jgi:hypothetical protein